MLEGGDAAFADGSVAAGEALDGEVEELAGAGEGEGFRPHDEGGQGEVPRGPAADGETADADERVAGVEGAVALVEEGLVAGDVTGRVDDAERTEELAFGGLVGDGGGDAGQSRRRSCRWVRRDEETCRVGGAEAVGSARRWLR